MAEALNQALLCELLYSSDSSDEEEQVESIMEIIASRNERNCIELYCESITTHYSETEFSTHFRIHRNLFANLLCRFEASSFCATNPRQGGGRQCITAEKHLFVFLWYVGHRASSCRDVADRFDISLDSFCNILARVNKFFDSIAKEVIHWPNETEREIIKAQFREKQGIPHVIGCVDGTHIRLDAPLRNPSSYFNRKKYYSIQMQGICDSQGKFIDVFVGYPGSVHDGRVMTNSFLYEQFPELCQGGYLLGDSAYALTSWCITPFRDNGHLSSAQKNFNKHHSSTRIVIEHTFGRLKQRFLILNYIPLRWITTICDIIMSCCVLHNLCLDDNFQPTSEDEADEVDDPNM